MAIRTSTAEWQGDLKAGKGTMTVGKGAYTGPFSFASRFEEGTGTNPEELIAAAHAGCFSMALSNGLAKEGFTPKKVATKADVHLGPDPAGGFAVSKIELTVDAEVPGIEKSKFDGIVEGTRTGCPISKLLKAEIVVKATLKS
ncbi:MAG TPA: OsmC family protein [Polyangiaceae bacterium]|jgi:osmotically inducible protein OsmC|nr:OsmC family protein [Polyangiaceae bacterium]